MTPCLREANGPREWVQPHPLPNLDNTFLPPDPADTGLSKKGATK